MGYVASAYWVSGYAVDDDAGTFSVALPGLPVPVGLGTPTFSFTVPGTFTLAVPGLASTSAVGTPTFSFTFPPGTTLVTLAQAKQYLDMALSVATPDFVVQAAIDKTSPYLPALDTAGYSDPDQLMIQCMAVALIAVGGNPRRLTSQHAPSGASRGFKVNDRDLQALRRSLAALDTAGVMAACVGPDPTSATMFMVV